MSGTRRRSGLNNESETETKETTSSAITVISQFAETHPKILLPPQEPSM